MAIKYSDIEILFELVSSSPDDDCVGYLCPSEGTTHFHSEFGDNFEELPEDIGNREKYIEIPCKHDFDLGKELVFEFVSETSPDDYDKVRDIFRKSGAYSRYKSLLASKGLLDQWHEYENGATERALREWLEEEGIEVID